MVTLRFIIRVKPKKKPYTVVLMTNKEHCKTLNHQSIMKVLVLTTVTDRVSAESLLQSWQSYKMCYWEKKNISIFILS